MSPRTPLDVSTLDYQALTPLQRSAIVATVMRQARATRATEIRALLRGSWRGMLRFAARSWRAGRCAGRAAAAVAVTAWGRHQERRQRHIATARLYAMDDHALKDIGLRRGEIAFIVSGAVDPTRRGRSAARPPSRSGASPRPVQRFDRPLILVRNGCAG